MALAQMPFFQMAFSDMTFLEQNLVEQMRFEQIVQCHALTLALRTRHALNILSKLKLFKYHCYSITVAAVLRVPLWL
jgi:hypothetical protein